MWGMIMTQLLVRMFVKNGSDIHDPKVRQIYGLLSGSVGILCNVLLCLLKLFAGWMTGAVSIMADAFNNLSDAASSVVTLLGFKMAGKPADPGHPFGHGRIEYLSGLFIAAAILLMGVELLQSSVAKIFHAEELTFGRWSVLILVASILDKLWMASFNRNLGKRIDSEAMKATAADSLSDCISTGAVLLGMIIFGTTGVNMDGIVGAIVAVFVIFSGFSPAKDTIQPLLGSAPSPELVQEIYQLVMSYDGVLGVHDMIVHDYPPGRRLISLRAEVSYKADILKGHDMIDNIEKELDKRFMCEATIHMDPIVTDDPELNVCRQEVEALVKEENDSWQVHDFRMVRGETHTNLIFDVVVSPDDMDHAADIAKRIGDKIHRTHDKLYAVVRVEQSFIGSLAKSDKTGKTFK